jgi:hypothetical protein
VTWTYDLCSYELEQHTSNDDQYKHTRSRLPCLTCDMDSWLVFIRVRTTCV